LHVCLFFVSCTNHDEEIVTGLQAVKECKALSPFVVSLGFNATSSAFTTSERKLEGLALKDFSQENKMYQDESWKDKGKFGPIAIDEQGNVYVAPVPHVNVLHAIRGNQNVIYKVDGKHGQLSTMISLTETSNITTSNPYGVVGLFYHCDLQLLYVSSINGSDLKNEIGQIFAIDVRQVKPIIKFTLPNIDAMGLGFAYFNNEPTLFYGNARNGGVYRILLDEEGNFKGSPIFCFDASVYGKCGDEIVKKIRFTAEGKMMITCMPFYYNLTAPTELLETKLTYTYQVNGGKWIGERLE
jgi:hypothetical protein